MTWRFTVTVTANGKFRKKLCSVSSFKFLNIITQSLEKEIQKIIINYIKTIGGQFHQVNGNPIPF